ncbi:haloacid dehalogenase superfamily enzyme, subfamily IA [Idiomarina sp. A28L]|uniref:HAD family hydrolase n=1 Tax=Idiomarina sp. A28L TaxID=1036674 RepID=UPI0002138A8D|nr:HAD-IA family hydrolase [Idiomarina sp. A28L]EGN75867.1 haloacid dehalogenase superfamily enzyme, subfamily IA [Idiomarina sp. A28L]
MNNQQIAHRFPLIIFDWDGTLMDSVPRIVSCMQKMAKAANLPVPAESAVRDIIGLSLWVALERLFDCHEEVEQQKLIAIYRELYVHQDATPSPLFPDVVEVLTELTQSGLQLGVATGKARQGLERAWKETNTGKFFQVSRCADEANSKPHPQMLNEILLETGYGAEQAIMIGDSRYDLRMASAAKMPSLGVSWGVHDNATLSLESPLDVLTDIADLPSLLRKFEAVSAE